MAQSEDDRAGRPDNEKQEREGGAAKVLPFRRSPAKTPATPAPPREDGDEHDPDPGPSAA